MAKKMQMLQSAVQATSLTYKLVSVSLLLAGTVLHVLRKKKAENYIK